MLVCILMFWRDSQEMRSFTPFLATADTWYRNSLDQIFSKKNVMQQKTHTKTALESQFFCDFSLCRENSLRYQIVATSNIKAIKG